MQEDLLEQLLLSRAAVKAGKKRKAGAISGSGKGEAVEMNGKAVGEARNGESGLAAPRVKAARGSHTPTPATLLDTSTGGRQTVAQKLAAQEQKRLVAQAGMSDAVRSMFKAKETEKSGGGAADFFGRTFNRVSVSVLPFRAEQG